MNELKIREKDRATDERNNQVVGVGFNIERGECNVQTGYLLLCKMCDVLDNHLVRRLYLGENVVGNFGAVDGVEDIAEAHFLL